MTASHSADVAAVVVESVVTVREVTDVVRLVPRARRVHHLESSLPNCEYTYEENFMESQN